MPARLIPLDGGPAVVLAKPLTVVGRAEDCDLRLDHKGVSKRHCVLAVGNGIVLVRDLGSTNGTRVNGQRVRRGSLLPDDQLAVATFRYVLKLGDVPPPPVGTAAPGDRLDTTDDASASELDLPPAPLVPTVRRNDLPDAHG